MMMMIVSLWSTPKIHAMLMAHTGGVAFKMYQEIEVESGRGGGGGGEEKICLTTSRYVEHGQEQN